MNSYHDLAEAMRKGAAMRPQCFEVYFKNDHGQTTASCALGAAYEGLKGSRDAVNIVRIENEEFRDVLQATARHPVALWSAKVIDIITDLNDGRQWTREAIADWLDTLAAPERRTATPRVRH